MAAAVCCIAAFSAASSYQRRRLSRMPAITATMHTTTTSSNRVNPACAGQRPTRGVNMRRTSTRPWAERSPAEIPDGQEHAQGQDQNQDTEEGNHDRLDVGGKPL